MQELHEMAGHHFMCRSEQQRRVPRQVRLLLRGRPFGIRRRYVVDRWQTFFVRTRNIDISEIPSLIRWRFGYLSFFSPGNRDNLVIDYESLQFLQLFASRVHRIAFWLVRRLFRRAIGQRPAGIKLRAGFLERRQISLQVLAPDRFQLVERNVHALRGV